MMKRGLPPHSRHTLIKVQFRINSLPERIRSRKIAACLRVVCSEVELLERSRSRHTIMGSFRALSDVEELNRGRQLQISGGLFVIVSEVK